MEIIRSLALLQLIDLMFAEGMELLLIVVADAEGAPEAVAKSSSCKMSKKMNVSVEVPRESKEIN